MADKLDTGAAGLFAGPGEVRALARDLDWLATPLGAPVTWSPALRNAALWIFDTPVPVCLWAGPHYALVYNDAYRRILSAKHPAALGQPGSVVWAEIWEELKPQLDQVRSGGAPLYFEDAPFVMARLEGGGTEHAWFSYSLSALRDEDGGVCAVLNISPETTARVISDAALKVSEAAARNDAERVHLALAAGAIIGTWFWNLPSGVINIDPAFAGTFGLDPALGHSGVPFEQIIATIHPDDRDGVVEAIDAVIAGGGDYARQYRVRRHDGQYHWIEANGHVGHTADGTPLQFAGVLLDISERRAADVRRKALAALADRVRDATDADDLAFAASTIMGETLGVSRVSYGVIDHEAETLMVDRDWLAPGVESLAGALNLRDYGDFIDDLKRGVLIVIPDVDKDVRTAAAATALKARSAGAFVNVPVLEHGRLVAVLFLNNSEARDWRPEDLAFVQEVADRLRTATDRLRAMAALRVSNETLEQRVQERTKALQDSEDFSRLALSAVNGVGVWTFDVRTNRFTCDAAISRLYGFDPLVGAAGLTAQDFLANVHPDDKAGLAATMAGGLQRPGDLELEYRLVHADGSVHWVLSRGHTYFEDGEPVRRTGVGVETTDKRQLEEQLRQSQKMEAVGQLTGGIAHDFNNLLAGITGSLELMQKRMDQQGLVGFDRHLGIAQASAQRAASLTQRLLAFSRRQTLDPRPVDVNRLIAGVEELFRRSVGPNIEIAVVGAIGLWPTKIDAPQLENALLNLVINARDAMPDGGRITIETANKWIDERAAKERDLTPGQYVSICVTDTGTGMPPEVIERAFDPFYTTKPLGQGTGLGLSMIHGFVRQSGGQVRIYSEVGQGTTMCLYLPRFAGELDADVSHDEQAALEPGQGESVLVIDDEVSIRMLIADVLGEAGYRVLEAGDGPSGLKILNSDYRIDLLITDVGLPGGFNGRQVADAARRARPDLKVLFVTGYADNAVIGNGHLDPGMQVITKPFPMTSLAQRVREIIEG